MPSSDLNDYIYLEKELKRLKEDNLHLKNENQELLSKIKLKNTQIEEARDTDRLFEEKNFEIENLKQEIYGLKKRLEMEKDQYKQDLIGAENSFQNKINDQFAEKNFEIEQLRTEIEKYGIEIEKNNKQAYQLESVLKEKENEIKNFQSQVFS